jgi:hypothetical protein
MMRLCVKTTINATHSLFLAGGLFLAASNSALALKLQIVKLPDGMRAVLASGSIVPGDAKRFAAALDSADKDHWGNKNVALNSEGGLVSEAFKIVEIMDKQEVSTIVPPGGSCASACAQIVFLAGKHHVVLEGGRLGIHSCSRAGISDQLCNKAIAQQALEHGVEYGSVMAFEQYAAPSDMVWLNGDEADCWGLSRWPPDTGKDRAPGEAAPCVVKAVKAFSNSSGQ